MISHKMKTPPFNSLEIEVAGRDIIIEQLSPRRQASSSKSSDEMESVTSDQNQDSVSSELSIDFLEKEKNDGDSDDSKLQSSSGSCRWNPDDSDYSLNVLLPPSRDDSPEGEEEDANDNNEKGNNDSVSGATSKSNNSSLLGSDYSLNKLRVRPNKNKAGKSLLDACSTHSTFSVDTFDTEFSVRTTSKLPDNIEVKKPKAANNRNTVVSFYPRVRIQRVPTRKLIPKEQMHDVWYSRDEFHVIRQECFKTIRLMKDDDDETDETHPLIDDDNNQLCRRGLEYKTPKAYKHRQKQKKEIRHVVFDELDFQEEQGMDDPEWLAKLSRDQSRSCVQAAIEVAREDERQARLYLGC